MVDEYDHQRQINYNRNNSNKYNQQQIIGANELPTLPINIVDHNIIAIIMKTNTISTILTTTFI